MTSRASGALARYLPAGGYPRHYGEMVASVEASPEGDGFSVASADAVLSPASVAAMVPLSRLLLTDLDALCDHQLELIVKHAPDLADNTDFASAARRICRDNITNFAQLLPAVEEPEEAFVTSSQSFVCGEDVARSGVSLSALLEMYRRGQALLFQELLGGAFRDLPDSVPMNEVLNYCTVRWGAYLDVALAHTVDGYLSERKKAGAQAIQRRMRVITALLDKKPVDVAASSHQLGYHLTAWHTGLVIHSTTDLADDDFERAVDTLTRKITTLWGGTDLLWVPSGSRYAWVWLGSADTLSTTIDKAQLDELLQDVKLRATVGKCSQGIEGFILTHRQAKWSLPVHEKQPGSRAVVFYEDIGAVSLIRAEDDHIATFVQAELGHLAAKDKRIDELRYTLLTYLQEGNNARRAAEILHTHKNTVLYRLQRAEALMGRTISQSTFDLELALKLVACYGDWTLTD